MQLLIIDPQNDFMDIDGAALPVAGADADMHRLAALVDALSPRLEHIVVTLDSHAGIGIERTSFWLDAAGAPVAPFTAIAAADLRAGRFRPRDASQQAACLAYTEALEAGSGRTLVAWPVHCVVGHWGHNLHGALAQSLARWELAHARGCEKVLKGQHPLTEQYSAFRAEVPRADDPRTQLDTALLARIAARPGPLLVAGEALSHCVLASAEDLLAHLDAARRRDTVFLRDCMSPVGGFEQAGADFLASLAGRGVRTMTAAQAREAFG